MEIWWSYYACVLCFDTNCDGSKPQYICSNKIKHKTVLYYSRLYYLGPISDSGVQTPLLLVTQNLILFFVVLFFEEGWIKWSMPTKSQTEWDVVFYFLFLCKTFVIRGLYEENLFMKLVFISKYYTFFNTFVTCVHHTWYIYGWK